jgi:hypothetical protein
MVDSRDGRSTTYGKPYNLCLPPTLHIFLVSMSSKKTKFVSLSNATPLL